MPRPKTDRIEGTQVPVVFKRFYEGLKKKAGVVFVGKKTVTTLETSDGRKVATVLGLKSTAGHMTVLLNKSRGWKPKKGFKAYDALEFFIYKTGDVALVVSPNVESQKQARQIVKKWLKAQTKHIPTVTTRGTQKIRGGV